MDHESLGGWFWLLCIGGAIAAGTVGFILFMLFGLAWYAWGGFVAVMVFVGIVVVAAWLLDRSRARAYAQAID